VRYVEYSRTGLTNRFSRLSKRDFAIKPHPPLLGLRIFEFNELDSTWIKSFCRASLSIAIPNRDFSENCSIVMGSRALFEASWCSTLDVSRCCLPFMTRRQVRQARKYAFELDQTADAKDQAVEL
jgi:hypothetical protein